MRVSDERLAEALKTIAEIVVHQPKFLPIYERIESEVIDRSARTNSLARAKMVAKGVHRPVLPPV